MKQDVIKEATKRAHEEARGQKFQTLDEMRQFVVQSKNKWAKHLYKTDKSYGR